MLLAFNPGAFNRRITIKRASVVQESTYGTQTVTWVTHCAVWANLQDVLPSRAEGAANGIAIAARPVRVRIRYRNDLDSSMIFTLDDRGNRQYRITTQPAEIGGRGAYLEFMAEELSTVGDAP